MDKALQTSAQNWLTDTKELQKRCYSKLVEYIKCLALSYIQYWSHVLLPGEFWLRPPEKCWSSLYKLIKLRCTPPNHTPSTVAAWLMHYKYLQKSVYFDFWFRWVLKAESRFLWPILRLNETSGNNKMQNAICQIGQSFSSLCPSWLQHSYISSRP